MSFTEFKDEMLAFFKTQKVYISDISYVQLDHKYWISFDKFIAMKDAPDMWKYTDWNDVPPSFQKEIHTQFAIILNNSRYITYDCNSLDYDDELWYIVDGILDKPAYEYSLENYIKIFIL